MKLFIGLQFYGDEKSSGKSKKQQQQKNPRFLLLIIWKDPFKFCFLFQTNYNRKTKIDFERIDETILYKRVVL